MIFCRRKKPARTSPAFGGSAPLLRLPAGRGRWDGASPTSAALRGSEPGSPRPRPVAPSRTQPPEDRSLNPAARRGSPPPPLPNLGAHDSASPLFPASPGGFGGVAEPPRPHAAMGTRLSPATFASPGAPRAHPRGSPHSYRSPPRGPTAGHAWVGSRGRLCPSSPEPRLPGPAQGRAKSAQGLGEARAGPGPIFNPTEGTGSPVPRGT